MSPSGCHSSSSGGLDAHHAFVEKNAIVDFRWLAFFQRSQNFVLPLTHLIAIALQSPVSGGSGKKSRFAEHPAHSAFLVPRPGQHLVDVCHPGKRKEVGCLALLPPPHEKCFNDPSAALGFDHG